MQINKQIGVRGKIIHAQSRAIIANVIKFMKNEADRRAHVIPITSYKQRVLRATGISDKVYRQVCRDIELIDAGLINTFQTPTHNRSKKEGKKKVKGEEGLSEVVHPAKVTEIYLPYVNVNEQTVIASFPVEEEPKVDLEIVKVEEIQVDMQQ